MNKNKKNKKIWKNVGGNLLIWALIIIMAVTSLQFFSSDYQPKTLTYSQFQEYIESEIIETMS